MRAVHARPLRRMPFGAEPQPDGSASFRVWAPNAHAMALVILREQAGARDYALDREPDGYWSTHVPDVPAGTRYLFRLDGTPLPDPASRFQPEGPSGPSEVVDPTTFRWTDRAWAGTGLRGQVIYEMHIGTFTPGGTWRSAADRLPHLVELGIGILELMPVSEFPGSFGWGYDGVFPYAPTRLYGTPDDFRAFVDRAHALGLAVILDVVYNHLGPDGSVLTDYSPSYFTDRYPNEWGDALNFDGEHSGPVRDYFAGNAAYWIEEFHLDGLRLDATQSVHDASARHVLTEIAERARGAAGRRPIVLVAENEPQDVRMIAPVEQGGHGLDGMWNDDFHHSAVVALTGRSEAYYADHHGVPQELISAARHGFLFQGQRYGWQQKNRGTRTDGLPPWAFVLFVENHDQIANSGDGSRLHTRTSPGRYRAMTALLLLLPGTPMLFQGQEFGSSAPFLFFADHRPEVAASVRRGRAEFVAQFPSLASEEAQRRLAPPDDPATFERCRLRWDECERNAAHLKLHRDLIALRRADAAFRSQVQGAVDGSVIAAEAFMLRFAGESPADERLLLVNFGPDLARSSIADPLAAAPGGTRWAIRWSSEHPDYGGAGTPPVVTETGWRIPGHAAIVLHPTNDAS